jgi:phospholipid:diacylglycerol acyltransferase
MPELQAHISMLLEEYDFNIPDMPGLDFSRMAIDWERLRGNLPDFWKFNNDGREFQVGEQMRQRGLTAEHPVILIPGVVSTVSWSPQSS